MQNDINKSINELINKFKEIRKMDLVKSQRNGSTGLGYTFESLIGKKEDQKYLPDFKGIEIKTKLGYTKEPITMFSLAPKLDKEPAIQFLLEKFGYFTSKNKIFKTLRANIFYKENNLVGNKFIFKLKYEEEVQKLKLQIFNENFELLNDNIYWNLDDIYERLVTKLSYLAVIKGYPYKRENQTMYKYTNINIYKLQNKENIINLIKEDKIYITLNIDKSTCKEKFGKIHDHGTAFKIKQEYIETLFKKIY